MNSHDIYMIEQSLDKLETADETRLSERLSTFFNNVSNALELTYESQANRDARDTSDVLFHRRNSQRKKNFIAVCLLRLLCRNDAAVWNHTRFRTDTFKLFDDQINLIYSRCDIAQGEQNHEKLAKLLGTEKIVLANFQDVTDSVVSLGSITSARQKFMSTLSSDFNMLFLEKFVIPSSLVNRERIDHILDMAQTYQESAMEDRIGIFDDLKHVFDSFLYDVGKHPSIFTKRCIVAPLEKIYKYVQEDFKNNDLNKPTTIEIIPLDRKYPFYEINRNFDLKFQVVNRGPGYAYDIHITCDDIEGLVPCEPENLGTLRPKHTSVASFPTSTMSETGVNPTVVVAWSWLNFNRSDKITREDIFELNPQRDDLNWNELKRKQPYSLEPIEKSEEMVGRDTLINQLERRLLAPAMESSIIFGQKRVGKTSIAKFIESDIEKREENYTVILISIGGLDKTTSERFVSTLGNTIVEEVSYKCDILVDMKPEFESSLSPLRKYFRDASKRLPNHRFVIILDEFDEIPLDMVRLSSAIGDTFFHNIRDISSLGNVGFILVGGENMNIIQQSTDRLNRMEVLRVDYFDRDDFRELVKRPVQQDSIEFNNEAINSLYESTEGNPFYTKIICRTIYEQACDDRNAYITEDNVKQAITTAELHLNSFNHLWKDGIFVDDPVKKDQIEAQRRKFLRGFGQMNRIKNPVGIRDFQDMEILKNEIAVEQIVASYMNREVLVRIENSEFCRLKPKIFEDWLRETGSTMMTSGALDESAISELDKKEQEAYIRDAEILDLCQQGWRYKGSEIQAAHVRAWLDQFENNIQRRLMFCLLQNVNFYDEGRIREGVRILHQRVQAFLAANKGVGRLADRRTRRSDILLSSFGTPAKSGSSYARKYADENRIYVENVASLDEIPEKLAKDNKIRAIVFVDDIIGSGNTSVTDLSRLNGKYGNLLNEKDITVFISAICGLHTGVSKLEAAAAEVPFETIPFVFNSLTGANQCFGNESEVFPSSKDRETAKEIALQIGKRLDKRTPLGIQDNQLLVVFADNCPNNSLAILRKKSTKNITWTPLFERR